MAQRTATFMLAAWLACFAFVVSVAAAGPTITEYPLPSGGIPRETAPGPDGNEWFTEYNSNIVGWIAPDGTIKEFPPLPHANSGPRGITTGPDGNIWIAEVKANLIGRVTLTGTVTEFPVPTANSQPYAITSGPDGNLWFVEQGAGRIGRITPTGSVVEFPLPPGAASGPRGIAAGPDGNIWFTEQRTNTVGRITPTGTITEFHLANSVSSPRYITPGPDGNLWFTEWSGKRIARITPAGVITEFPTASGTVGGGHPLNITTGPDGNIWWTRQGPTAPGGEGVGTTSPTGAMIGFISTPTQPSSPGGIKTGSDGNLWFTEEAIGRMAKLAVAQAGVGYAVGIASGFAPATRSVAQGATVHWELTGPGQESVTDASGLGLFDSGPRPPVSYVDVMFAAAGSYPYASTVNLAHTGTVQVATLASPTSGSASSTFAVTWASGALPTGLVADVQVLRPGAPAYVDWQSGRTGASASFVPDGGVGTYGFQARLRNPANGKTSGWSPAAQISVS